MILSETSRQWAQRITEPLPATWQRRMLDHWNDKTHAHAPGDFFAAVAAERAANVELRELLDRLGVVRVPLDATDSTLCQEAERITGRALELATVYRNQGELRFALERMAQAYGITPPIYRWLLEPEAKGKHVQDGPAIARMSCPIWWRRQLRKVHAQQVETAAIFLGYVNRKRECYASDNTVFRRAAQNRRNAASLEATTATNELGQEFTLAELAAKGTANKAIRRAELMTRIAGFERIARDMGHAGLFLTITCPSRMHRYTTAGTGHPVQNRKFDGTTPRQANQYLGKVWARIRAKLHREGMDVYGFRIAEPQHDGTPHWHMLIFHAPQHYEAISAAVWRYALADSADEKGAAQRRCDFKPIDPAKGSAAGYIAKYVSKNIDGYAIEKDLTGEDAITASARVEAWASTWGIRQFQQVGGAPVGPWRELRRVQAMPAGVPQYMQDAHRAAQRIEATDTDEVKAAAWDEYIKAQGGVQCGRDYRVRVALREVEGLGRYGEPLAAKPCGVETQSREIWFPQWMQHIRGESLRVVHWFVESVRHVWTIARKGGGVLGGLSRAIGTPWTRVNNCTEQDHDGTGTAGTGTQNDAAVSSGSGGAVGQGPGAHQSHGRDVCRPGHCGSFGSQRRIGAGIPGRISNLMHAYA